VPAPPGNSDSRPPLAGIRVVSLGVGAVVPGLCRTLAELGAQVVKIEARAHPDFLRRLSCVPGDPDVSLPFNDENRGQRSVRLDLATPRGRELALALCARADVVAENHRSGFVARFGLDAEAVQRVNPGVVYLSSQGYGEGGPLAHAPAFGPLNAAFAGVVHLWGPARARRPAGSHLEHPDHVAGHMGAVAVLAALEHRRLTGEGQRIELAQTEAAAFLQGERYLEQPCTGRPASPQGNAAAYACPHGVYPAAGDDRWVAIAVVGDETWRRFRGALRWKADPALDTLEGRLARRRRLDGRVAAWTRRRDAHEAAAALQAAGVSAMAVVGPLEHRDDPHLAARRALVVLADPQIGPARHVAPVVRFARSALPRPAPAPRLGADTRAVLERELGLSRAEIAQLVRDGICG
jgi:benzylsuccinate CoA-transferase BbsF subunit